MVMLDMRINKRAELEESEIETINKIQELKLSPYLLFMSL